MNTPFAIPQQRSLWILGGSAVMGEDETEDRTSSVEKSCLGIELPQPTKTYRRLPASS